MTDKLESLKKEILAAGGMTSNCNMIGLYTACGFARLGKHVPGTVSQRLRAAGIGHIPTTLPQKHTQIRAYLIASPIGQLIESVLTPDIEKDEELLSLVAGAAKKIAQIKEILSA